MKHEKSRVEPFGNGRLVKGNGLEKGTSVQRNAGLETRVARLTKAGSLQPKPSMIGTRLGRYRKLG